MRVGDDVAWTADGSRVTVLLLSDAAAGPLALEASAAVVWEEIATSGPISVSALLRRLVDVYEDTDPDGIRDAIEALLEDLASRSLITA